MIRQTALIALLSAVLSSGASAEEFEESIAAQPGGTLRVDLDAGSVDVETHDRNEVRVEARAQGWLRSMDFELSGDGTDTQLVGKVGGWLVPFFGNASAEVRVRIPERYSVGVRTRGGSIDLEDVHGEVRARTSGGSITLDEAEGPVDLQTSGGSVEVEEVAGDLTARTSGGSIRVSEIDGSVELRTSGGNIDALDVRGPLMAHTSGGSISARFTGVPEGSLRTSGGSIEAEFPEDASVTLDARTSGGRVHVEHEILVRGGADRSRIEGKINGGGPKLELRTSGGNIRVRAR
jgi:hypothetical protein